MAEAFRACQAVFEHDPHNIETLHLSGLIAIAFGRNDIAVAAAQQAVTLGGCSAHHHNTLGLALAGLGRLEDAAASYTVAVRLAPDEPSLLCNLGFVLNRLGRNGEAARVFRRALALDPTSARSPVQRGLSLALYPGYDYQRVLSEIHEWMRPATYVEIGVSTGASLALVRPPTRAIGIDPAPRIQGDSPATTQIFATTSDQFFAEHDLRAVLGGRDFDLAFVDGLHTFEQTLADIANLERSAGPDSIILVHDVLPADEACAARDCRSALWAGDTWKIIPALCRARHDLELSLIPAAPTGLAAIRGLAPTMAQSLSDLIGSLKADLMALTFADFCALAAERQPLIIANDPATIKERLTRARPKR